MDFTCHASKLLTGLNTVTRVLSTRTTNPILEGVLIKASRDGLQLTCSDGAVSIVTRWMPTSLGSGVAGQAFGRGAQDAPCELRIRMDSGWHPYYLPQCACASPERRRALPALPIISAENSFPCPRPCSGR